MVEKVEVEVVEEDYEELAKELENASPLEIIDKALEKFGNDIAIAFRYLILFNCGLIENVLLVWIFHVCLFENHFLIGTIEYSSCLLY